MLLMFDLDGTLIDSAPDLITAANTLLTQEGRAPLPDKTIIAAIGMGTARLVRKIFADLDDQQLTALTQKFFAIYERVMFDKTRPYPGVVDFLKTLDSKTKIACVTNKDETLAKKIIAKVGLGDFPWLTIVGGNTYEKQKPDPLPLLKTIEYAKVKREDAVMIGDGTPDMRAAKLARVHSVALSFGYSPLAGLQAENPTVVIDTYAQLPAALAKISSLPAREG